MVDSADLTIVNYLTQRLNNFILYLTTKQSEEDPNSNSIAQPLLDEVFQAKKTLADRKKQLDDSPKENILSKVLNSFNSPLTQSVKDVSSLWEKIKIAYGIKLHDFITEVSQYKLALEKPLEMESEETSKKNIATKSTKRKKKREKKSQTKIIEITAIDNSTNSVPDIVEIEEWEKEAEVFEKKLDITLWGKMNEQFKALLPTMNKTVEAICNTLVLESIIFELFDKHIEAIDSKLASKKDSQDNYSSIFKSHRDDIEEQRNLFVEACKNRDVDSINSSYTLSKKYIAAYQQCLGDEMDFNRRPIVEDSSSVSTSKISLLGRLFSANKKKNQQPPHIADEQRIEMAPADKIRDQINQLLKDISNTLSDNENKIIDDKASSPINQIKTLETMVSKCSDDFMKCLDDKPLTDSDVENFEQRLTFIRNDYVLLLDDLQALIDTKRSTDIYQRKMSASCDIKKLQYNEIIDNLGSAKYIGDVKKKYLAKEFKSNVPSAWDEQLNELTNDIATAKELDLRSQKYQSLLDGLTMRMSYQSKVKENYEGKAFSADSVSEWDDKISALKKAIVEANTLDRLSNQYDNNLKELDGEDAYRISAKIEFTEIGMNCDSIAEWECNLVKLDKQIKVVEKLDTIQKNINQLIFDLEGSIAQDQLELLSNLKDIYLRDTTEVNRRKLDELLENVYKKLSDSCIAQRESIKSSSIYDGKAIIDQLYTAVNNAKDEMKTLIAPKHDEFYDGLPKIPGSMSEAIVITTPSEINTDNLEPFSRLINIFKKEKSYAAELEKNELKNSLTEAKNELEDKVDKHMVELKNKYNKMRDKYTKASEIFQGVDQTNSDYSDCINFVFDRGGSVCNQINAVFDYDNLPSNYIDDRKKALEKLETDLGQYITSVNNAKVDDESKKISALMAFAKGVSEAADVHYNAKLTKHLKKSSLSAAKAIAKDIKKLNSDFAPTFLSDKEGKAGDYKKIEDLLAEANYLLFLMTPKGVKDEVGNARRVEAYKVINAALAGYNSRFAEGVDLLDHAESQISVVKSNNSITNVSYKHGNTQGKAFKNGFELEPSEREIMDKNVKQEVESRLKSGSKKLRYLRLIKENFSTQALVKKGKLQPNDTESRQQWQLGVDSTAAKDIKVHLVNAINTHVVARGDKIPKSLLEHIKTGWYKLKFLFSSKTAAADKFSYGKCNTVGTLFEAVKKSDTFKFDDDKESDVGFKAAAAPAA